MDMMLACDHNDNSSLFLGHIPSLHGDFRIPKRNSSLLNRKYNNTDYTVEKIRLNFDEKYLADLRTHCNVVSPSAVYYSL